MDEKLSLKWNDFLPNVSNTFRKLRTAENFFDVTLVSDDQQQVFAHKVVLASSSEYFKNILTSNKHSHPMLCLSGVNTADLKNMLDFVYNGEIQIDQNNLDNFLEIAQRFQLEGLQNGTDEDISIYGAEAEEFEQKLGKEIDKWSAPLGQLKTVDFEKNVKKLKGDFETKIKRLKERMMISVPSFQFENIEELELKIDEIIEKQSDGPIVHYKCLTCGKIGKRAHIREHAELHIGGLCFPCQFCDKSFRLRNTFRRHKCTYQQ